MNNPGLILFGIKSSLQALLEWLKAFGPFGLFGISLVDSVIPLPGGPDVVMIGLSATNPALMPLYAMAATAGSTIGCTLLYLGARRAGVAALNQVTPKKRDRIENLLGRYDMIAVMVPAVLPPPFPFKAFVLCAGAFKLKMWRFITAILIGRLVRFLIEGWLAIRFGGDAERIIKQHGWKVLIAVLALTAIVIGVSYFKSRGRRSRAISAARAKDEKLAAPIDTANEGSRRL
jgi:membrane protein YqaA with SNARE-associated domain